MNTKKTYLVYYMKPEYFRDGIMGYEWLRDVNRLPNIDDLTKTHIYLMNIEAENLEGVYMKMQGENLGCINDLLEEKGLRHTSMSMGDIAIEIKDVFANRVPYMVDSVGFTEIKTIGFFARIFWSVRYQIVKRYWKIKFEIDQYNRIRKLKKA